MTRCGRPWPGNRGRTRSNRSASEMAVGRPVTALSLAAWLRARDFRVDAYVIQRTSQNGQNDRARLGAVRLARVVVVALTSRDRADDQPYDDDYGSDAHYRLQALYPS